MPAPDEFPKIRPISPPMDVPVYNVVIYVSHREGRVQARVANLPKLQFNGGSEPTVLKQAITEVKSRLTAWTQNGQTIPWIAPVPAAEADEQERFVPVHL